MTTVSVIIATYGEGHWEDLAKSRAWPTAIPWPQHSWVRGSVRANTGTDSPNETIMLHLPDGTRASSLNEGARQSLGEWLLFLDADDEFAPGYVGAMRRALEQHRGDGTRRVLFTPAVQHIRKGRPGKPSFWDRGISLRDDNWLVIGTMIHRDLFARVGGFDDYPHGFEDWALWSKCHRLGATVVKVPDAVYRYYHNPQSAHKKMWRDRKWQVATHQRVQRELDAWEAAQ